MGMMLGNEQSREFADGFSNNTLVVKSGAGHDYLQLLVPCGNESCYPRLGCNAIYTDGHAPEILLKSSVHDGTTIDFDTWMSMGRDKGTKWIGSYPSNAEMISWARDLLMVKLRPSEPGEVLV